jgi:putative transposase
VHELDARRAWGRPATCVSDNGTELTGTAVPAMVRRCGSSGHSIAPSKPQQNALLDNFNARLRDE